jgi:hypothetical protein
MKTLLTSAALAAMMTTSAMANFTSPTVAGTAVWNGQSPTIGDTCSFKTNTAGKMNYDETTYTWSTEAGDGSSAVVELRLVKQAGTNPVYPKNIKVEPAIWNGNEMEAGGSKIDIHNGNSLTNPLGVPTEIHKATVNYGAPSGGPSKVELDTGNGNGFSVITGTGATKVNTNSIEIDDQGNINGILRITVGGSAVHDVQPPVLTSAEDYQASHLITCTQ